ncbi:MAG: ATP-binding protein [Bauldia sp.]|nr:ATP-binding protein [Bauldia sp.]MCW5716933.1 ATP-binding protein [Bauldia sp.]
MSDSNSDAARPRRGHVTAVGGSHATVQLARPATPGAIDDLTVGKMLEIQALNAWAIAVVTSVAEHRESGGTSAEVDLLGEIVQGENGPFFQRGITEYPSVGSPAAMLSREHLRLIYDIAGPRTINIGTLSQDSSVGAYINVDEMLHKHFAVLGTTGVGKSTGVALLLREVLRARPKQRIFLIDPHNEYAACFGDKAEVLSPTNLRLPYWLFNFEEMVDVIFRARPGIEEEVEILSQVIAEAKNLFAEERDSNRPRLRKVESEGAGYTVDTPVPYRMSDLLALIDKRMGKLENRSAFPKYHRLITRIETVSNDPRYRFMFQNANVGGDTMVEVLSGLFNLTDSSKPVTVMQLAGFPGEVVDSVVSVLCRMAFEFGLWGGGLAPLLIVCEEAHRYAPADRSVGFGPTRKAVSRIAKEGRKYGVFIGLVTQRPAELDATIVSQCSTLFAMRMANDLDQAIVRSAVSDAAAGLLAFVPALGVREVFAFGEGVALPTRIRFGEVPKEFLPRAATVGQFASDSGPLDAAVIAAVVERWRGASMSRRRRAIDLVDEETTGFESPILKRPREVAAEDRPMPVSDRAPASPPRMALAEAPRPAGTDGIARWPGR